MGQPAMIQPQKSPPPKPQLHQIGREQPHLGTPPRHLGVFKARLGAAGPWGGGFGQCCSAPGWGSTPFGRMRKVQMWPYSSQPYKQHPWVSLGAESGVFAETTARFPPPPPPYFVFWDLG